LGINSETSLKSAAPLPIQVYEVTLMKWMVGSQSWKQADACWTGSEDGRTWPEGAVLQRVGTGGTSGNLLEVDREPCDRERGETRQQKVERLRRAIACGEYRVSAEDLAERLLVALFDRSN
jgi:hypothetical protein